MFLLRTLGWLLCVIYSTIPLFWFMVHPRAHKLRHRKGNPFRILVPAWLTMWIGFAAITAPWRMVAFYATPWSWLPALALFTLGIFIYFRAGAPFSLAQFGGLPEILPNHRDDRLITTGIRARVRHPIYLAHLCEMFAWSVCTGLLVCWLLTAFALITGAVMIRMEDAELQRRFGEEFAAYRRRVPALLPRISG
jgi:protein-S-isoprenylcysteine O-methyltransferase Ste14